MMQSSLEELIQYIVTEAVKLKNKYAVEMKAKIEFADIFSRDDTEYQQLTTAISQVGKVVYSKPTGDIYSLQKPIQTVAGELYLVKIRKPDKTMRYRGDADFNTDYPKLKQKYQDNPQFEYIIREKFEMLRLSDPEYDVMTCFSNIPVRKWI